MTKITINESRLHELIQESIYEVLNEWQWLDNISRKLGAGYQNIKTGLRHATRSFNAGRNDIRDKHKDFNEYAPFGDRENDLRRMSFGGYPDYRYDIEKKRNEKARGINQKEPQTPQQQNNTGVQPHPNLIQQNNRGTTPQNAKMYAAKTAQEFDNMLKQLTAAGIKVPQMTSGRKIYASAFKNAKGGKLTLQQKALIQQMYRNPIFQTRVIKEDILK
jgi:hypothetical protein